MNTEYEIRVLEIDKEKLIKKLEELGAEFKGDNEQKRYVYDTIPKEDGKWIRLRTNGKKTTLTYKNVVKTTIDGTKELEIEVSDFEKTNELLENMGIKSKGYEKIQGILLRIMSCTERGIRFYGADDFDVRHDFRDHPPVFSL